MRENRVVKVFGFILLAIIFAAGFGEAVLHLWNWLMPAIFGLHTITYWQAIGLLCLSWLLFGGKRGARMPFSRHRMGGRWARMTPEEREKFRQRMRERCGNFGEQSSKV
jgi:hypothetical protein